MGRSLGLGEGWRVREKERRMGGMPGPMDPLELTLLLEAAENLSGLDRDNTPPVDEAADDGNANDGLVS